MKSGWYCALALTGMLSLSALAENNNVFLDQYVDQMLGRFYAVADQAPTSEDPKENASYMQRLRDVVAQEYQNLAQLTRLQIGYAKAYVSGTHPDNFAAWVHSATTNPGAPRGSDVPYRRYVGTRAHLTTSRPAPRGLVLGSSDHPVHVDPNQDQDTGGALLLGAGPGYRAPQRLDAEGTEKTPERREAMIKYSKQFVPLAKQAAAIGAALGELKVKTPGELQAEWSVSPDGSGLAISVQIPIAAEAQGTEFVASLDKAGLGDTTVTTGSREEALVTSRLNYPWAVSHVIPDTEAKVDYEQKLYQVAQLAQFLVLMNHKTDDPAFQYYVTSRSDYTLRIGFDFSMPKAGEGPKTETVVKEMLYQVIGFPEGSIDSMGNDMGRRVHRFYLDLSAFWR